MERFCGLEGTGCSTGRPAGQRQPSVACGFVVVFSIVPARMFWLGEECVRFRGGGVNISSN